MIHPREIEILNILFASEEPMISADIVEKGNRLSQSTVQAVLRKISKEGLVTVEGVTHSGNVLSRTYRPTEKARELVKQQFIESYESIKHIVYVDEIIKELRERGTKK